MNSIPEGRPTPNLPRTANKRGVARLAAVQALFQMDVAGTGVMEVVAEYEAFRLGKESGRRQYLDADPGWFRAIVAGAWSKTS